MRVALSGLNNSDNPAPGIGVAKSLPNVDLIGFAYEPTEPGIYQGLFKKVYMMPFPSMGYDVLADRLSQIQKKDPIDLIIPNLDAELPLYIKHQDRIEKEFGIKSFLPTMEQFESRDKTNLTDLCSFLKVLHPPTVEVVSISEIRREAPKLGFPLFVKGKYYKAYKVYSVEEAIEAFMKIIEEWGVPVLLQKIVEGTEINLVGVSDGKRVVGSVAIKKLMITELGKVWSAITIKNDELDLVADRFVLFTKYQGAFELECIANNEGIYLIEINPRFPAWVHFATMVGVNLPSMLIELALGNSPKTKRTYPLEKMYVRYVEETCTDYDKFLQLLQRKEIGA